MRDIKTSGAALCDNVPDNWPWLCRCAGWYTSQARPPASLPPEDQRTLGKRLKAQSDVPCTIPLMKAIVRHYGADTHTDNEASDGTSSIDWCTDGSANQGHVQTAGKDTKLQVQLQLSIKLPKAPSHPNCMCCIAF